jgi:hypothetical protein
MNGGTSPSTGIRLRLQLLPGSDRALALASLLAERSDDGSFLTNELQTLQTQLRLPPMANASAALGRLRDQGLLMRPRDSRWALTPLGEHRLNSLGAEFTAQEMTAVLGDSSGADFGDRRHTIVPPVLGPMAAEPGLARILDASPFEQNVMLITRFPKAPEGALADLIKKMRLVARRHGLKLMLASDVSAEDTLWANVVTHMWACRYAIVVIDHLDGVFNSNVLIEVGGMLMTGRRCAILRDKTVPAMPTDLVGHIYKRVELSDHEATLAEVHRWFRDDLGLSTCAHCPPEDA